MRTGQIEQVKRRLAEVGMTDKEIKEILKEQKKNRGRITP